MSTQREKIIKKAIEILRENPEGVRYMELFKKIKEALPDVKENTIHGTIYNLDSQIPETVEKPVRGLFKFISFREVKETDSGKGIDLIDVAKKGKTGTLLEENFYQAFADYLATDLDECTKAISLGGNKFRDKWGTPDVIGVYKFSETEPLRPSVEIISAEIKSDTSQLITAFGQACSYKLFSHKVYLVIPKNSSGEELGKIESLCSRFGIGLILFDTQNKDNPNFEIRTRATKSEPDYFYVNRYLKLLDDDLKKLF